MRANRVVATIAVIMWGGSLAVTVGGFFDLDNGGGAASIADWTRLNTLLLITSAVLSVTWVIDRFIVCPRSAYKLGVEAGERRAARKADPEPVPLPVRRVANGNRIPTPPSW